MNERLKELRKQLGLSQEKFGKILGITKAGVCDIESCRRAVTEKHIIMLKHYGINEDWIRTGQGEIYAPKTKEGEIADIVDVLYREADKTFRYKLIKNLSQMDDGQLSILENFIKDLLKD